MASFSSLLPLLTLTELCTSKTPQRGHMNWTCGLPLKSGRHGSSQVIDMAVAMAPTSKSSQKYSDTRTSTCSPDTQHHLLKLIVSILCPVGAESTHSACEH